MLLSKHVTKFKKKMIKNYRLIRVWWLSFFSVSFYLCVTFILGTWINWNEHPVTISFTEKERPISAIPFPTVTICPETKAPKHVFDVTKHINDYLDSNSNLTDTE